MRFVPILLLAASTAATAQVPPSAAEAARYTGLHAAAHKGDVEALRKSGKADLAWATSWNSSHQSRGCGQDNLRATGGDALFYCFASNK